MFASIKALAKLDSASAKSSVAFFEELVAVDNDSIADTTAGFNLSACASDTFNSASAIASSKSNISLSASDNGFLNSSSSS